MLHYKRCLYPILTDDPETAKLHEAATAIVSAVDPSLSIHDFRVTPSPNGKTLLFDVAVPYAFRITDEALAEQIRTAVETQMMHTSADVTVDRMEEESES